jgi:hypothetical protein
MFGVTKSGMTFCQKRGSSISKAALSALKFGLAHPHTFLVQQVAVFAFIYTSSVR